MIRGFTSLSGFVINVNLRPDAIACHDGDSDEYRDLATSPMMEKAIKACLIRGAADKRLVTINSGT
jgi:hypothetical protein